MSRPLPIWPRGEARSSGLRGPRGPRASHLLACPRISPHYQLDALRALIKPQLKEQLIHRSPGQPWPAGGRGIVVDIGRAVADRIGVEPVLHFPPAGDFHFLAEIAAPAPAQARALAVALSRRMPELWFTLDRLLVRDGRFFRRQKRIRLGLTPASNVHLPRELRARLRGLL